ncbi:carboxypeptidase-like regulatory domain-containing protein [Terriglobus saanensis]|uniref:Carboxypeptidase regulatory-like domain-containing protein n=1 Tax=Terriglobus saanensis (strain ATCC BAA-1853 / DSM 23119 / SP1PR4) TaxID=401053 RepID=E8V1X1_TERSS|nr:carboxypeptidase-like regulatory domain-containing protein [Terriglobus saanensis]ADV83459.1 hypothetical protein AciPR4_2684 [Terriglobus saanensis SP1PR4]
MLSMFSISRPRSRLLPASLTVSSIFLILSRCSAAQGSPLEAPAPFKSVVTVRGGGIEHNAPYRVPQRVVQGFVRDANEKGIAQAEVFLRDEKTSQMGQMLADENGNYLFGGLPLEHDYQVWAKVREIITPKRPVRSFIGMHDVTINFHIPTNSHAAEVPRTTEAARR